MSLINFILDIAALLLWLSWRSIPHDPLTKATPATLAGTVKRAEPTRLRRWHFPAVMLGLLFFRGLFYWQIGPAIDWTPRIDLGLVAPAFPVNVFVTALLFSLLSFVRTWMVFHFWLLALVMINGSSVESNPVQKLILLQLGRIARWPRLMQAILPVVSVAAIWIAIHLPLVRVGVVKLVSSPAHLLEQGAVLGVGIYLTLKNVLPVLLFLHLVSSYVYLGASPAWDFIGGTARRVLLPLKRLPLRFRLIDFTPLVGIILILLLLHFLPNFLLAQLSRPPRNFVLWPQ